MAQVLRWVAISQGLGKFEKLIQLPAGDGTQVCFRDYAFHVAQDVCDWVMWRIVISFEKSIANQAGIGMFLQSGEGESSYDGVHIGHGVCVRGSVVLSFLLMSDSRGGTSALVLCFWPPLALLMKKLARFRVKELKDVLSQLGLAKQGRKQDLLDRIVALFSSNEEMQHSAKNISIEKEGISKIVDDVYRKLQGTGTTDSAMSGESDSNISRVITKEEAINPSHVESIVRCPCGSQVPTDYMIQCADPGCHVMQHFPCVIIPDQSNEGSTEVPPQFYCEVCRVNRADPAGTSRKKLEGVDLMLKKFGIGNEPLKGIGLTGKTQFDKQDIVHKKHQPWLQSIQINADLNLGLVWCMLLNDSVPFRMQWPQFADLKVNGIPIQAVHRPGSQLLGTNGRDNGPSISLCLVEGVNKISLSGSDARCFCLGVRVVKQHTVQEISFVLKIWDVLAFRGVLCVVGLNEVLMLVWPWWLGGVAMAVAADLEVLNLIPAEGDGEPFADALARVCRCIGGGMAKANDDSDSDLEVVADFVTVNLRCPMQDCGQDINEIDVKPDGSWRIKNGYRCMDLGQWHLPDGSPNVSAPEVDQNGSAEVKVCRSQDMQTLKCEYLEEENSENYGPEVITMSSGSSENVLNDGRGNINHRCSKHFDVSAINGDKINSRSYNFDKTSENANRSSSRSFVDADVVILSDSEEENVNFVLPRTVSQTCPLERGISYSFLDIFPEDMPLVAGTTSSLDPTENSGKEFKMRHQSFPYGTQTDTGFQLFGNAADFSDLLDGLEHTSVMSAAPRNGYTLSTSLSTDSGGLAVDFSSSHSTAGITESLVTNPVATAIAVPSEHASFQTQPAKMLQQSDVSCGLGSKTGGAVAPIESSNSTGVDLRNHSRSNTVVTVTADPSEQASFQTQPAKILEQSDVSCGLGNKTGGAGAPIEPSTSTGVDLRNHSRSNRVSLGSTIDETRSNGATNRKRHDTLSLIHLYSLKNSVINAEDTVSAVTRFVYVPDRKESNQPVNHIPLWLLGWSSMGVVLYVVTKYQNLLSQISLFHLVPDETDRVSSLHGGFDQLDHPSGWRSKALFGRKACDRQIVTAYRPIM
ncbi:hypothetical protein RJ639_019492 [Escallonia herrerae]|uniref:SAP domain-containing protein n=1 Tax=Escallonia herrerae TaxID=1293975 RepID=A0AA89AJY1_9ASTE|nr:hypothetical protein RJ639_019492 [Escallonia herrerae]